MPSWFCTVSLKMSLKKKQWIAHAQLQNKDIKPTDKLCSQHFLEKYIDRTGQITRLKSDAVPTLFAAIQSIARHPSAQATVQDSHWQK